MKLAGLRAALFLGLVASCSSEGGGGGGGTTAGACDRDGRKDVYTAGLTKPASVPGGAAFSVKLMEATPGPPIKGDNALTLEIADGAGTPVAGATVTVTPFMPDHGHGSAVTPEVTALGGGRYKVTKLYLPMAGLWQVTVTVAASAGPAAQAVFNFCLDG